MSRVVTRTGVSPSEKKRRRADKAVRAAFVCLGLLWLLWLVENFVGERFAVTCALTYVPQHPLLVFPVALGLFAALRREWRAVGIHALAVGFWLVWGMGLVVPLRRPANTDFSATPLRAMTFNIFGGSYGFKNIATIIARENPDIICFQEARHPGWNAYAELKKALPGYKYSAYTHECATFSRFPITSQSVTPFPGWSTRAFLSTELNVKGTRLWVVNAHFSTVSLRGVRRLGHERWLTQVDRTSQERLRQADTLFALTEGRILLARNRRIGPNDALLVLGDFNTPPRGRLHRRFATSWTDSFAASGAGFGHSFSSTMPVVRIDYVWARGPRPMRSHVVDTLLPEINGLASDHCAVVADLEVANP